MQQAGKVVVITGASTGLGLATAVLLAKNSHTVYATMRNLDKRHEIEKAAEEAGVNWKEEASSGLGRLRVAQLDVTSEESVNSAIAHIVEKEGRVDVLINNAGYSVAGSVDDMSIEEDGKKLFETNLWGVVRMVKATMPHFRKQGEGQIINVASVGGVIGFPFQEYYCASKFAVEGFTESLAISNAKLNVKVSLVEPGAIKTPFFQNAQIIPTISDERVKNLWGQFVASMQASSGASSTVAQTPEEVAAVIKTIVDAEKPHLRYQTGPVPEFLVKSVKVDPTGANSVQAQLNRFFKE